MKKNRLFLLILPFAFSCSNELSVVSPSFDVQLIASKDTVGESGEKVRQVTFEFNAESEFLTFYSGEAGNDYEYRTGRKMQVEDIAISFGSTLQFGKQANQLSVLIATDFSGIYTPDEVNLANWIDVTDRFTLASQVDNTVPTFSGDSPIADLVNDGNIFIAFRYTTYPQATNGKQSSWRVRDFMLTGVSDDSPVLVSDQFSANWNIVNIGEVIDPGRSSIESNGIVLLRGNDVNTEAYTETWAITAPINIGVVDLGPDNGVPLKNLIDPAINTYRHNYSKSGTYTATFVAKNISRSSDESIVRQLSVVIP